MCGEKNTNIAIEGSKMGSPPRVRGKEMFSIDRFR